MGATQLTSYEFSHVICYTILYIATQDSIKLVPLCRGVGTGPAGPATAGPMFPEPTIKSIIPLFVNQANRNFYITAAYLYHFNKGCTIILSKEQDTNLPQATTSLQIKCL